MEALLKRVSVPIATSSAVPFRDPSPSHLSIVVSVLSTADGPYSCVRNLTLPPSWARPLSVTRGRTIQPPQHALTRLGRTLRRLFTLRPQGARHSLRCLLLLRPQIAPRVPLLPPAKMEKAPSLVPLRAGSLPPPRARSHGSPLHRSRLPALIMTRLARHCRILRIQTRQES